MRNNSQNATRRPATIAAKECETFGFATASKSAITFRMDYCSYQRLVGSQFSSHCTLSCRYSRFKLARLCSTLRIIATKVLLKYSFLINLMLFFRYRDQLQRGVDLALALFHVNIHPCTLELLNHSLPQLLYNNIQTEMLMEPQLSALALLTSYCIYSAIDSITEV